MDRGDPSGAPIAPIVLPLNTRSFEVIVSAVGLTIFHGVSNSIDMLITSWDNVLSKGIGSPIKYQAGLLLATAT